MKPSLIQFDLGDNRHGQPIRLLNSVQDGARSWSIVQDPANQRDDSQRITGLSAEQIQRMADATKGAS